MSKHLKQEIWSTLHVNSEISREAIANKGQISETQDRWPQSPPKTASCRDRKLNRSSSQNLTETPSKALDSSKIPKTTFSDSIINLANIMARTTTSPSKGWSTALRGQTPTTTMSNSKPSPATLILPADLCWARGRTFNLKWHLWPAHHAIPAPRAPNSKTPATFTSRAPWTLITK